ncbi:MAG: hypothetical protein BWY87_00246 [Deltaproteobacteria bacterium ADurb.Bin510]|nr:MAG: hypothetical protein BWY87_00246 [Deltaproteobacteria bacterium ADurb.Bin510]
MSRGDQAGLDGGVQLAVARQGAGGVNLGHDSADQVQACQIFAAAQFSLGLAQQIDEIAGLLGVHGDSLLDVGDLADHRNQDRRRNRDLAAGPDVVVLHAVLAGNQRTVEGLGVVVEGLVGAHQLGQLVLAVGVALAFDRVAPAEVVEAGPVLGVAAHADIVAQSFVQGAGGHVVGVEVGVARHDAVRDDHAGVRIEQGPDHAGVRRSVVLGAGQGLDDRAGLDLVVVLAHHVFLGADVQAAQHGFELGGLVGRLGRGAVVKLGRLPLGRELEGRQTLVHEVHVEVGHRLAFVGGFQVARVGEGADDRSLDVHLGRQGQELVDVFGGDRQAHALLGFGNQNLPGLQAGILEQRLVELDAAAAREFGHLADRGREAAGAVIGDGAVEALVAGAQQKVEHLLLGDRVADLHGADRRAFVQLFGGEGRAVDAVLADAAAGHDDLVAGQDSLFVRGPARHGFGHDAGRAAVD